MNDFTSLKDSSFTALLNGKAEDYLYKNYDNTTASSMLKTLHIQYTLYKLYLNWVNTIERWSLLLDATLRLSLIHI